MGEADENGEQRVPSPASGHRLLVVDDSQDAAESLALLLRPQSHEVRVASGGAAALETTKTYTPEVVFLDLECRACTPTKWPAAGASSPPWRGSC